MHHLPQFFNQSEKGRKGVMSWKQKPRKPRLTRSNAKKNIEYEASSTTSSSSAIRGTRSLDITPFRDQTSFRIDGNDGELDRIFRSLDISSPDDLGISTAAWEARKVRCSSDLLPRSRLYQKDSSPNVELQNSKLETVRLNEDITELADGLKDNVRITGGSRGGIKGVRPPLLAPPPSNLKRLKDDGCSSTWDILRSFAPDGSSTYSNRGFSSSDNEDEEEANGESARRLGETIVLSESCSFTTSSNEDDSSSTTTEPTSRVSPNGRFKRIVTSWQKGELLGRGSFGSVYEGIADDGFFIAVKEVSLLDQGDLGKQSVSQLEQEIALLSQFEHENIVQYYGTDKDESKLYIFLELVNKGSLLSLYRKYHLRDSQVSAYTRQILHGLKYLHDRNVVHRDIKCANILVDASGSVKLADFGLAKATKLNDVKSCKGSAFWMAPEVVHQKNHGYGLAADIWSLGCTVLEMLTQQLPYYPLECMPALFRIGNSKPPPVPDSLSREARDFILKCLHVNPNDRPTAAHLLDHPFVKRSLPYPSGSASPHNYG